MSVQEHLDRLVELGSDWNKWRVENPNLLPDLSGASLPSQHFSSLNLAGTDLRGACLSGSSFHDVNLRLANLSSADLSQSQFFDCCMDGIIAHGLKTNGAVFHNCNCKASEFVGVDPNRPPEQGHSILTGYGETNQPHYLLSTFEDTQFWECIFEESKFDYCRINECRIYKCSFDGSSFRGAHFTPRSAHEVSMKCVDFSDADLCGADLRGVAFSRAIFRGARLIDARLGPGRMVRAHNLRISPEGSTADELAFLESSTDLTDTDFREADLTGATVLQANMAGADMRGARVFGVSSWKVNLDSAKQTDLIVSRSDEPLLTVDNLEVAQFIYLMVNNPAIGRAIETIASKAVLILGRFSEKGRARVGKIAHELRRRDRVPIVFDFEKPAGRTLTETVATLASLARYVVADLTDGFSVIHELNNVVKDKHVPVQCLMVGNHEPYTMYSDLQMYPWMLPHAQMASDAELISRFELSIVQPCEEMLSKLRQRKLSL